MSRMDSHSLLERLSAFSANGTLSTRLTLASREHDSLRLPMLTQTEWSLGGQHLSRIRRTATARAASAVLQDLRLQMKVAEDLIAKLGYQMRELQKLRTSHPSPTQMISSTREDSVGRTSAKAPTALAKVLNFRPRAERIGRD